MITAYLIGDTQLIARLSAMPDRLRSGVGRAVLRLGLLLQRKVQSEKLTGQVLKVRTGSLRSSINLKVDEGVTRVTASVGTNIQYAGIHELGGTQPGRTILPKRGRALAFEFAGARRFFASVDRPTVHYPERSFLRSALREMQPEIKAELEAAVHESLRG